MAISKPSDDDTIMADWDTGKYSKLHGGVKSQRDLAYEHNVSVAKINKMVKGREPRMYETVNDLVKAKQILAAENEQTVNAVNKEVAERTSHIDFFNKAALLNTSQAMKMPCDNQSDHRMRADTIAKGREVVLGKTPDTVINNTNAQQNQQKITYEVVR